MILCIHILVLSSLLLSSTMYSIVSLIRLLHVEHDVSNGNCKRCVCRQVGVSEWSGHGRTLTALVSVVGWSGVKSMFSSHEPAEFWVSMPWTCDSQTRVDFEETRGPHYHPVYHHFV